MDQVIEYVLKNPKKIAVITLSILFVSFVVYFFTQNSLVYLTVTADEKLASDETAAVILNSTKNTDITPNSSKLLIVPNTTSVIEAATTYESTVIEYIPTPVFSSRSIALTPQVASKKLSSNSGDCAYQNNLRVVNWNCDTLNSNTSEVQYDRSSFPIDQTIDSLVDISYQQPYRDGFLGIQSEDSVAVTYVDASTRSYKKTIMPLDDDTSSIFTYASTQILIDRAHPDEFAVLDTATLQYRYYSKGVSSSQPKLLKLPIDQASEGVYVFSLHDRVLSVYNGNTLSSDDDHSSDEKTNTAISPTVRKINLATNIIVGEKVTYDDSLLCDFLRTTKKTVLCRQGSILHIYSSDNNQQKLSLDRVSGVEVVGEDIYVAYQSGIYRFNENNNSLEVVFKIPGRDIGSVSSNGKTIIATSWFNRLENSQQRISYILDTTKQASYPRIEDKLPISFSDSDSITGSDFYNDTIYVSLLVPGKEYVYGEPFVPQQEVERRFNNLQQSTLSLLKSKGIDTDRYDIKFYY